MGDDNDSTKEQSFQKLSQTIAVSIQKIHQNVSKMNRLVNQFGTGQENSDLKPQLQQLRSYTQQLIKDTDILLKDLVNSKDRHLKIQRERLVDDFTASLTAFQAVQRKTVEIEKNAFREAQANNYKITKPPGSNKSSQKTSYNSRTTPFEDNFVNSRAGSQTQVQIQQEDIDLQALEEQERSIRDLEENIVGVNEIYKKLGALVYEQGLTVDSIESSVEQTSVFVSEGTDQLRKASHYQTKLRKKKLFIALILAVIVAIITGIIYFS